MNKPQIYAELMFILEQVPYSYNKLIPDKIKDKFKEKMSITHYNSFDKDKVFYKQQLARETIVLLGFLYYKYWCKDENAQKYFINIIDN